MIARVSLVRKLPDLSQAAFREHWLGPHSDIARQLPGLRGYVVYTPLADHVPGCDGIAITWFDTEDAAAAGFSSDALAPLLARDRPKFLSDAAAFIAAEHVLLPPPRQA